MERLDKMFSEDLLNKVKEILNAGRQPVEEEQIDKLSKGTMGSYITKAARKMSTQGVIAGLKIARDEKSKKNFKDINKRETGIARAVSKLTKEEEELDEGRGRPPKEGSEAFKRRQAASEKGEDDGESEHIIASLRKASHNMTGRGAVKFKSGIEMVNRDHAMRAAANYMDKRTPDEKDEYLSKISHSYGHLKKNI